MASSFGTKAAARIYVVVQQKSKPEGIKSSDVVLISLCPVITICCLVHQLCNALSNIAVDYYNRRV
jgi:hypothetical protein